MMKTYAVKLTRETFVEGIKCEVEAHMGALTSECGPLTLLGLIQYHHAVLEEIVDEPDDSDELDDADTVLVEGEADTQPSDEPPNDGNDSVSVDNAPSGEPNKDQSTEPTAIALFLAAGLDQKTAEALVVANNIGSIEELKMLMSDPKFDLIDLEDIGSARAEKIKALFPA